MDGSVSSLLNLDQFCRDCFTQYRDMKAMDPLNFFESCQLVILANSALRNTWQLFIRKWRSPYLETWSSTSKSLLEATQGVNLWRVLGLAKAIWLLHLLAFSLDPQPSQFEVSRGAEFHPQYMESVVKFSGGRIPIVGFPVSPGFKLGNGSVIKASVYLVPRARVSAA